MRVPFRRTVMNGLRLTMLYYSQRLSNRFVPLWTRQPLSLQVDRTNRKCPLECVYCNPQNLFVPEVEPSELPLSTIKLLCDKINLAKWRILEAYPWMNTDPLCDLLLNDAAGILKDFLKCSILISTNGVLYHRRHMLRNRNFSRVEFTISASSPEGYRRVHGKPLFREALSTFVWFYKNKFWNQHLGVRFIAFRDNIAELAKWRRLFSGFSGEIRPLHFGCDRKISSTLQASHPYLSQLLMERQRIYEQFNRPCACFHNLSISFRGEVMQCCDLPYKYNWGHIEEVDLEEVWQKRLELGLDHHGCRGCNQKNRDWRRLFEKYVWEANSSVCVA